MAQSTHHFREDILTKLLIGANHQAFSTNHLTDIHSFISGMHH